MELKPCPFCGGEVVLMAIAGAPYPPTYKVDLAKVTKQYYCGRGWDLKIHDEMCDFAHNVVADAPTVEPKRGEWVEVESYQITGRCSCCGWEAHLYEDDVTGMNYCPNCGADMRGEKND